MGVGHLPTAPLPWIPIGVSNAVEPFNFCWCIPPLRAPMWYSWTDNNPGRRFFNCPKEPVIEKCRFFEWCDEPFPPHAVDVINGLRREKLQYGNEIRRLLNDGCQHCRVRIAALRDEVSDLKSEVEILEARLAKQKRKMLMLGLAFCVIFLVFMWMV